MSDKRSVRLRVSFEYAIYPEWWKGLIIERSHVEESLVMWPVPIKRLKVERIQPAPQKRQQKGKR